MTSIEKFVLQNVYVPGSLKNIGGYGEKQGFTFKFTCWAQMIMFYNTRGVEVSVDGGLTGQADIEIGWNGETCPVAKLAETDFIPKYGEEITVTVRNGKALPAGERHVTVRQSSAGGYGGNSAGGDAGWLRLADFTAVVE